jgi:hypothetical protein
VASGEVADIFISYSSLHRDLTLGSTTIQVTMTAADPGDPVKGRYVTVALPHRRHGDPQAARPSVRWRRTTSNRTLPSMTSIHNLQPMQSPEIVTCDDAGGW